jgi:hypothetical protein
MLSMMTISNSPALSFLRCAAASRYSGDSWQPTAFSKLGNSMTMKRWNFSGPSRILNLPPRQDLAAEFPDDRRRQIGVLLVLLGIVDLRARDPIGDHLILHANRERPR